MGDTFYNITNSTIINRSHVEGAFNRAESLGNDELAQALIAITDFVERSGDPAAGAVLGELGRELDQEHPDGERVRRFWDGLVAILPGVAKVAGAAAAIAKLFV